MDETNEVEALAKVAVDAYFACPEDVEASVQAAALAVRDAVRAMDAARGGTLSAEQMAELERACEHPSPGMDLIRVLFFHATAQGRTVAALEQDKASLKRTFDDAYGDWMRTTRELDDARATITSLEARAEQAERERDEAWKAAELPARAFDMTLADAMRYWRGRAEDAESALATLRQKVGKLSRELQESDDEGHIITGETLAVILQSVDATPAPAEHPDTGKVRALEADLHDARERVAELEACTPEDYDRMKADAAELRAIRERAKDVDALVTAYFKGIPLPMVPGDVSVDGLRAVVACLLGDSGPSGGGETCCGEQGKCSDCPSGLAACVPVEDAPLVPGACDGEPCQREAKTVGQHRDGCPANSLFPPSACVPATSCTCAGEGTCAWCDEPKSEPVEDLREGIGDERTVFEMAQAMPKPETLRTHVNRAKAQRQQPTEAEDWAKVDHALAVLDAYGLRHGPSAQAAIAALARLKQASTRAAEEMRERCAKAAPHIVEGVLGDLAERNGVLNGIDAEVMQEIRFALRRIVEERIRALPLNPG